ncbi:MAG: AraC family transcriptional regulator, partial [Clostridia bacterium]|nr:AraC family transcriptional regulator [Clostridia bacterium]
MYYNKLGEKIICYNSARSNDFLHFYMAGVTYPNPNYLITHNISKHRHWDQYNFEYIVRGKGHIETPTKKFTVKTNDLYFLNRLQPHIYYADKNDPFEKMFIVVSGNFVENLLTSYKINESLIIRNINVEDIFIEIHKLLELSSNNYDEFTHLILKLVQNLHSLNYNENPYILGLAENIRAYIDDNIHENINLLSLQKSLNISKSHIERVFKKKYNVSPIKYAINRKLEFAASLLITTNFSISSIAANFAFNDAKYFSKTFKAHYGVSPSQY